MNALQLEKETCGNCHFAEPSPDDPRAIVCRRFPPCVLPMMRTNPIRPREIENAWLSIFPTIQKESQACGEWRGRVIA
jgi:hypothetical protein